MTMAAPLLWDGLAGKAVTVGSWMFLTHQSCARSGSPRCASEPGAPLGHSLNACGAGDCATAAAAVNSAAAATKALTIMLVSPSQKTRQRAQSAIVSGQPVLQQL